MFHCGFANATRIFCVDLIGRSWRTWKTNQVTLTWWIYYNLNKIIHVYLGPLHTQAKSRDHGIVRAQRKVSRGLFNIPRHGPSIIVWSHMWPGPQPNAISMNLYSCGASHMVKSNKSTVMNVWSAMVSRFCVRPTLKRWFSKIIQDH